ncbi:LysR family transcriptional regulator [Neobacillus niacini]|uniref:LysR family transcriptional regulator n=1 Tax=Neobacillus niacini TaxID=86668 RepID=UPI0021CAF9E4|nr:LysR family transcriptional regulator [Neobacillus niacini]MCM3764185.1 LysR family transcriptional regulator [Neobacillus niacini]
MEIRQLTYFTEVAKEKSFTIAARNLHISQPALSKMVKNLEDELGVQLFDRSEKFLHLTDAGEQLYERAQKLLFEFESLSESIRDTEQLKKGHIKVGIPPVIGTSYFPKLIAGFRQLYPGVILSILEEGAMNISDRVEDGSIDAGVIILPVDETKFDFIPIFSDENKLIVHRSHPLASKEVIDYEDLKDESFVLLNETFKLHHHIIASCRQSGFEPNITIKSSQWDFIAELVAMNQGISILPRPILDKFNSGMILQIPINHPSVRWDIAIILKKGRYTSYALRRFIEYVKQNISS